MRPNNLSAVPELHLRRANQDRAAPLRGLEHSSLVQVRDELVSIAAIDGPGQLDDFALGIARDTLDPENRTLLGNRQQTRFRRRCKRCMDTLRAPIDHTRLFALLHWRLCRQCDLANRIWSVLQMGLGNCRNIGDALGHLSWLAGLFYDWLLRRCGGVLRRVIAGYSPGQQNRKQDIRFR